VIAEGVDLTSNQFRASDDRCRPLLLIDGEPVLMRPSAPIATVFDLALGRTYEACEPITLAPGRHLLESVPEVRGALVDVMLAPPGWFTPAVPAQGLDTVLHDGGALDIVVPAGSDGIVRTNISSHPGWRPQGTSLDIGPSLSLDGGSAWFVASGEQMGRMDLRFRPEWVYRIAWAITACTLVVCAWLIVPRPRRRR
jgi:hypothetical protein